ncbi:hypothetical protein PQ465_02215 [Sphingobacterium oryzagri]|uniref:LA2681-like HEPN domain-containing protein n=1 Tax=Sphingobacterium oryzagri TaxID=3025669 RepID=A0ABY7WLC4_9SPHI|nr:hypothetical protein [Sphingobacterium sp. KACC 22765]WDF69208.1 hypothetical protein PQ465_02215 [Sphingobacterium sp. KACC 22765]
MQHLEQDQSYITLLSNREILDPFAALHSEFCNHPTVTTYLDRLFDIVTITVRKGYWRMYESPATLYRSYLSIARVLEAGWLLSKIMSGYKDIAKNSLPYEFRYRDSSFGKYHDDNAQYSFSEGANILLEGLYMEENALFGYRGDLHRMFFEGLEPSEYMWFGEFDRLSSCMLDELEALICLLHHLYSSSCYRRISKNSKKLLAEELLAAQKRQARYLYEKSYNLHKLKAESSSKQELYDALAAARSALVKKDYWKTHGEPGNMLLRFDDLLFLMEYFHDYLSQSKIRGMDIDGNWNYPDRFRLEIYHHTGRELSNPLLYLNEQFSRRNLEQWRSLLDACLDAVLDNAIPDSRQMEQYSELLEFLCVLIALIDIIEYEPYNDPQEYEENNY